MGAAMVDTVAREKPNHTMAMEDMVVDMEVMVDTVAREKPKLPQLHTMAVMEVMVDTGDMVVDMEVMVDTVAREKPKLPQLHTMAVMVDTEDMVDTEVDTEDTDTASKPTVINL